MAQGRQLTTQRPQQLQPLQHLPPAQPADDSDHWETEVLTASDGQRFVVPVRPASRQTLIVNHNYYGAAPPQREAVQSRGMDYVELDRQEEAMYQIEARRQRWRDSMFARESGLADVSLTGILVFAIVALVALAAVGPHWVARF